MKKLTAAEPETRSMDIVAGNIEKLKILLPEVFIEGAVDFDALKQLLGGQLGDGEEKFGLTWHGKRRARQLALNPSTGTLRPCPEESLDWDTTKNVVIEGDNLEVLKLLQKSYAGKFKLIYIDPPYNTGHDLLYPNDFQDGIKTYLEVTGQIDGGTKLTSNTDASGRYHTTWLNLMYPRLRLARTLLRKDGVLICTIDENEMTNLGVLLKEVFEEGNFEHVCVTIVHNPRGVQGTNFSYTHEYAFFVIPKGQKLISDRKIKKEEVDWSPLRNWGTESARTDAKNCFYPVIVEDAKVVGFGDVLDGNIHPAQTEKKANQFFVYPIDTKGIERKWRYARQSVEEVRHLLRPIKTATGYDIEIGKDFETYRTVWSDPRYDANKYGTQLVKSLVDDSPFTFPKSLLAVYDCILAVAGSDKNAMILDFFAGSGTTGHATLALNSFDGGTRRYVLVQLPEKIEGSGRYRTIADVTKERMRSASKAIKAEKPMFLGDLGFRVYKLDSSNIQAWDPQRENLPKTLAESIEHLKLDRTEADILHELLLKLGLDLCVPIEQKRIVNKRVHSIGGGVLLACLDAKIARADIEPLAQGIVAWHKDLSPASDTTCVFRDSAFVDDVAKTNLAAILNQNGLTNVRSL